MKGQTAMEQLSEEEKSEILTELCQMQERLLEITNRLQPWSLEVKTQIHCSLPRNVEINPETIRGFVLLMYEDSFYTIEGNKFVGYPYYGGEDDTIDA